MRKIAFVLLLILLLGLPLNMGAVWAQNVGLLSDGAVVFASDAPAIDRYMAAALKSAGYGSRIQICNNTDDQVEWQAAVTAAAVRGSSVRGSPGTFTFSGNVTIPNNLMTIKGTSGLYGTAIRGHAGYSGDLFVSTTQLETLIIEDIEFSHAGVDGGALNFTAGVAHLHLNRVLADFIAKKTSYIINVAASGSSFEISITNSSINNNVSTANNTMLNANEIFISNSKFKSGNFGIAGAWVEIVNNGFEDIYPTISVAGGSIGHNYFSSPYGEGMRLNACTELTISDNQIINPTKKAGGTRAIGISIQGSSSANINIHDNVIKNTDATAATRPGIEIGTGTGIKVHDNQLVTTGGIDNYIGTAAEFSRNTGQVDSAIWATSANFITSLTVAGKVQSKGLPVPIYTGSTTVNWANASKQWIQLASGAQAITFSNPADGESYILILEQPTSGAVGTVTWPANVWWPSENVTPSLSSHNNTRDVVAMQYWSVKSAYLANISTDFND